VKIRAATASDVPAILDLLRDDDLGAARETAAADVYRAAFTRMAAEPSNTLYLAETAEGRVVGTYQLTFIAGLSHRGARRAQVESVRVAGDQRGRGLGRRMFQDAELRARRAGCAMLQLTTMAERDRARAFYESLGYTPSHVGYKKHLAP